MLPFLIAEPIDGRWRPGIGDPSFLGWLTVAAYFAAALACALAARAKRNSDTLGQTVHPIFWRFDASQVPSRSRVGFPRRVSFFWWTLALGMLLLGINKQLDLQSILPIVGRQIAREQGWYEQRREVQRAFILGVALLGVVLLAILTILFRSILLRRPLATIGLIFLYLFVLVRASSFHRVDLILGSAWLGLRVNGILELGGIGLVLSSAMKAVVERSAWFGRH